MHSSVYLILYCSLTVQSSVKKRKKKQNPWIKDPEMIIVTVILSFQLTSSTFPWEAALLPGKLIISSAISMLEARLSQCKYHKYDTTLTRLGDAWVAEGELVRAREAGRRGRECERRERAGSPWLLCVVWVSGVTLTHSQPIRVAKGRGVMEANTENAENGHTLTTTCQDALAPWLKQTNCSPSCQTVHARCGRDVELLASTKRNLSFFHLINWHLYY